MDRMKGKVVVVTGAASGLGRGVALLLAKEDAQVVATDINDEAGQTLLKELRAISPDTEFQKQDVSNEAGWQALMDFTLDRFGKLNGLVNCAGVFMDAAISDLTLEQWRWVMSVNLDGVFLGTKYGAEAMKKSGGGAIVNFSSVGGLIGTANSSAYNASKGGVRIFSKAAAVEFSKAGHDYNIRVNSVHPGVIQTPMTQPLIDDPELGKAMVGWTPIGHFGEPLDVAYGVLYLLSDEAKFVTGSELVIDGGWSAQ